MHPTLPTLSRVAINDYKLPGYDLIVKKGTPIVVSIKSTHMDPEYFPEPHLYLPERFDEGSNMYKEYAFFPFGIGPR